MQSRRVLERRPHSAANSARDNLAPHKSALAGAETARESDSESKNRQGGLRKTINGTLGRRAVQIVPMKMIPKRAAIESLSLNAVLAVTLALAASANAICLLSYL